MAKFNVTIEELVSQTFAVEAADMEEAQKIAEKNYKEGKFVVDNGYLTCKQMQIEDAATLETTEWFEF